jgi:DNA mismatch repair protein MSH6
VVGLGWNGYCWSSFDSTSEFDTELTVRQAVLHQLATHTLPLSIFATHYGSLTDDFAYHPNIRNVHMATIVDEDKRDVR